MSRAAVKWVDSVKGLSRSQWTVLSVIADLVGGDGCCAKTQAFIAGKVRLKERRVREILSDLEALGVISRERRTNKIGRQAANLIRINFGYGQPAISAAWPTGNRTGFGQPAIFATPIYNITPDFSAAVLPVPPTKRMTEIRGDNDNVLTFPLAGGMR